MSKPWLMVMSALAGCGGGGGHTAGPDGPTADGPPKKPVVIQSFGNPTFAMFRDGSGPWQPMTADANQNYNIEVTADYEYLVVCKSTTEFDALMGAAMVDEGRQFAFCSAFDPPSGATVAMTGTMAQAGSVWMSATASSPTANWSFSLDVPSPSTQDLFAFDNSRLAIRRSLAVTDPAALPAIDLAAEGVPLVPQLVTVDGLDGDPLRTEITVFTTNGLAVITGSIPTLHVPASSQLTANDQLFADLFATTATTLRRSSSFGGVPDAFPMPPKLTGVAFDGEALAAWDPPPSGFFSIDLEVDALSGDRVRFSASPGWLVVTGATRLAFDASDVPGYDPAWKVDPAQAYQRVMSVGVDGPTSETTEYFEAVNGGAATGR